MNYCDQMKINPGKHHTLNSRETIFGDKNDDLSEPCAKSGYINVIDLKHFVVPQNVIQHGENNRRSQ